MRVLIVATAAVLLSTSVTRSQVIWTTWYETTFDDAAGWTFTDPDLTIVGGRANWFLDRLELGDQYMYRALLPACQPDCIRITVIGRVDSATNNCRCLIGVGPSPAPDIQNGLSASLGYYGAGCSTQGFLVDAEGLLLDHDETSCNFTGTWLWIDAEQDYSVTLTVPLDPGGIATLEAEGVGWVGGHSPFGGPFATLYIGMTGTGLPGGWGQCSGSIDFVRVEYGACPSISVSATPWAQIKSLYR